MCLLYFMANILTYFIGYHHIVLPTKYDKISDVPTCLFYQFPQFTKEEYDEELKRRRAEQVRVDNNLFKLWSDEFDVDQEDIPHEWTAVGICYQ